jgi:FkbM family methyltransferase
LGFAILSSLVKAPIRAFYRARGYCNVQIGGIWFKCDPFHIGFWREVNKGSWEPRTFQVLNEFLKARSTFVDVGAWIGPTVLFAARRAEKVYCFEPDPRAFQYLLQNLQLNRLHNVTPLFLGLASETGARRIAAVEGLGSSHSSLLVPSGASEETEAQFVAWSEWHGKIHCTLDLIKMDIEGGEFELLPTMRDYLRSSKPTLYISLHAPLLDPDKRGVVLAEIADVLSVYNHCYDEDRAPVSMKDLISSSLTGFKSFLLTI